MGTKPDIMSKVIHFLYDGEENKHNLINTINLSSHAITEYLREKLRGFPLPLFYVVFHSGDIVC